MEQVNSNIVVVEGKANETATLSNSIEVKPGGFLQKTLLNSQVVQPF